MRRPWILIGIATLAAVLVIGAACGDDDDDGDDGEPTATEAQVDGEPTATEEQVGEPTATEGPAEGDTATVVLTDGILTDAGGNTLYTFDNDGAGSSSCTGACVDTWPPLLVDDGATAGDGVAGTLSTISRDDGSTQVAFNDQPLYYYSGDAAAGDRTGDGVGGVWHIVEAGG